MLFGLQDIRGYDTVILRDYVEYLELIEPQRGIPYSKVAKLFDDRSLDSPLLDLLNVKYVLTSKRVSRPGWSLAYEGEGIRVYRNERVMPRAFVVADARYVSDRAAALLAVGDRTFDPCSSVILEPSASDPVVGQPATASGATQATPAERPATASHPDQRHPPAAPSPLTPAQVVEYGPNRVVVRASAPSGGVLVLGDVFFPGWRATVDGVRQPVLRANGVLRGVELGPGEHIVVFEYRPFSVQIGAFISALSALTIGLLGGYALLWSRRPTAAPTGALRVEPNSALHRVAKNSAFPMASSLLNKGIDIAFALVMFRILQAEGVGAYTFAGVLVGYLDTLVGFGLVTLITREVARDHALAGRYLGSTLVVRLGLWLGSAAITALLVGPLAGALDIDGPLALTLWLLVLGLLPGIVSSTVSALFLAHEQMEYPAVVTVATTLLKVALGLGALLAGWGYVGLAGVSVAINLVTMLVLVGLYARTIGLPAPVVDLRFGVRALDVAFPLMINSFLNALFFKVDAILLKPLAGDLALGWYSTAYKFIDGLQVIPSSFVLAVFPLLSRHAHGDPARLAAVVTTALKVLLVLAFPIAVGTTILADSIILLFAGAGYLPQSSTALQVLIWYLPLSFVNGLTQYVLIALNRTRTITLGFAVGLAFNLTANLLLIPRYGYLGASAVTIASEAVLLVPFWWVMRRELSSLNLVGVAWRPAIAALVMAGPVWLASGWSSMLAIPVGGLVYGAILLALGTFDAEERRAVLGLLSRRTPPIDAAVPAAATPSAE
ncbi:MAG: oligosaccharide flippase family protein, partial [Chloroflexota bacterium]|nr:oligosaccharide flippase family protein [Chloroflexota bacterium]